MTLSVPALISERIPVEGTHNLRDVGGMAVEGGGETRFGRLYRSDSLHALTGLGRGHFADLHLSGIIDLRGLEERTQYPSAVGAPSVNLLPIFDGAESSAFVSSGITLAGLYLTMADRFGERLANAVALIAETGEDAVLVHCMAGKDRTGLVIALALLAVGVSREDAVADYAQTEANLRGEWSKAMLSRLAREGHSWSPNLTEIVTASPATAIEAFIDHIETTNGSALGYLRANGLDDAAILRLNTALVGPSTGTSHPANATNGEQ